MIACVVERYRTPITTNCAREVKSEITDLQTGYVHDYGYPANVHKLRTDQWWWSIYTSTHQSLSLIETKHAPWLFLSFSPYLRRILYLQKFHFQRPEIYLKKYTETVKRKLRGSAPHPLLTGLRSSPGGCCLAAEVLDNHNPAHSQHQILAFSFASPHSNYYRPICWFPQERMRRNAYCKRARNLNWKEARIFHVGAFTHDC